MARYLSIKMFAWLFTLSLVLSAALAYHATTTMRFAVQLPAEAAEALTMRIQLIRAVGLGFALLLMLLVIFGASRAARGALALRWLLGVVTSAAFLRGAGLVDPLARNDMAVISASCFQLGLEAFSILLLYGEDASQWFDRRRLTTLGD